MPGRKLPRQAYGTTNTVWVQCTQVNCGRWRRMPRSMTPKNLNNWECSRNINPHSSNKCSASQESWSDVHDIPLKKIMGCEIDPLNLCFSVLKFGGIEQVREEHKWQMVREDLGIEQTTSSGYQLNKAFKAYWEEDTDVEESDSDNESEDDSEESGDSGDSGESEESGESGEEENGCDDNELENVEEEEQYESLLYDYSTKLAPTKETFILKDEYRTNTCSPRDTYQSLQSFKPILPKRIALPPKVYWKKSILTAQQASDEEASVVSQDATAALDALDALEKQKSMSKNAPNANRKRSMFDLNHYNRDIQPAWRASKKRNKGWSLIL